MNPGERQSLGTSTTGRDVEVTVYMKHSEKDSHG